MDLRIYAPVAKMQTLKFLFSFCCQFGLIIEQMDVVMAFLNGEVSFEVNLVGQPKGYSDKTKFVKKICRVENSRGEWGKFAHLCFSKQLSFLGRK